MLPVVATCLPIVTGVTELAVVFLINKTVIGSLHDRADKLFTP